MKMKSLLSILLLSGAFLTTETLIACTHPTNKIEIDVRNLVVSEAAPQDVMLSFKITAGSGYEDGYPKATPDPNWVAWNNTSNPTRIKIKYEVCDPGDIASGTQTLTVMGTVDEFNPVCTVTITSNYNKSSTRN